jgi:hypothetical protein
LAIKNVVIIEEDDRLEIRPAGEDLSRFVDAVEVGSEDFNDYHKLRKARETNAVLLTRMFSSAWFRPR